jgi:ABC-type antimicrobial peptide transport system permease subunit
MPTELGVGRKRHAGRSGSFFFAMQPLAQFLVPGVRSLDSTAFLAVIGVLGAIAVLAIVAPALRALRVDPMTALRYE